MQNKEFELKLASNLRREFSASSPSPEFLSFLKNTNYKPTKSKASPKGRGKR